MKKTDFIGLSTAFLLMTSLGCQSKQPTGTEAGIAATTLAAPSAESSPASQPTFTINTAFASNSWYKGDVGGTAVWLYIANVENESVGAAYGYESQQGANIQLSGKIKGDNLELTYETYGDKPYKESFTGTIDRSTGNIKGDWKNSKKTLPFQLQPLNILPNSGKELLDCAATLSLVEFPDHSHSFFISGEAFKKHYAEKKYAASIPNMKQFISKIQSAEEERKDPIEIAGEKGTVFCKTALPNNQWLLFFAIDTEQGSAIEVEGVYAESSESLLCAAIFDADGNCLNATRLGNDGEDSYYMDFGCKQTAATQLSLTWTFYARGQAREEEDATLKTIEIKNGNFVVKKG